MATKKVNLKKKSILRQSKSFVQFSDEVFSGAIWDRFANHKVMIDSFSGRVAMR